MSKNSIFANSITVIIFLTLFANSSYSSAQTSVWQVSKNNQQIYLGGTIHVLRPQDYPLPKAFKTAFKQSQILTFETDINAFSRPEFIKLMLQSLSYQDERTVESVISKPTYQKLKNYAEKKGLSLNFYRKAKPGMLMSALLMTELKQLGISEEGIDLHYLKQAKKYNKATQFFETPAEQLSFLANMGEGNEDNFYLNLLTDLTNTEQEFAQIIQYWRTGDSEKLAQLMNESMQTQYPKMYQYLLLDRNNNWLPKIEDYFKTSEVEFILVGAAHLVGEDGIINQLKRKGYQVKQL
ncbi:TraB/GumN family protein [Aliikangiella maris]|uniref:TraB/GumN family protein n=2 Tax=Aliikangiella maris TaxID=3162458 RepID=A0ABV3MLJ8_9GAMM